MEKQTVVDTLKINYIEAGNEEQPPLLLLHGWGCSSAQWSGLIQLFRQDYHIFALDFPGFGKSEEPEVAWGSAEYCLFTEHFLRAVKVKDPVVIAHSFGGRIGIMLAARGFASKLVLADSAGLKPHRSLGYYSKVGTAKVAKKLLSFPGLGARQEEIVAEQRNRHGSADYKAASPLMKDVLALVVNEDLHPYLERIKVPTLIVWGSKDMETPLSDGEEMERVLKRNGVDTALIILTGLGHFACFEVEKRFYKICEAFI